ALNRVGRGRKFRRLCFSCQVDVSIPVYSQPSDFLSDVKAEEGCVQESGDGFGSAKENVGISSFFNTRHNQRSGFRLLGSTDWLLLWFRQGGFFSGLHPLGRSAPSLAVDPLKGGHHSYNFFPLRMEILDNFVDVHVVPKSPFA